MTVGAARAMYFGILLLLVFAITGCTQHHLEEGASLLGKKKSSNNELLEAETILVTAQELKRTIRIPSELAAFRVVEIYPKVQGFVKTMNVDRGAIVTKGQVLVEIVAPELDANYLEAEAKYDAVQSSLFETESKIASLVAQMDEAKAKLDADRANYKRIQIANKTVGAIAPVDLESAELKVQGDEAKVRSAEQMVIATRSALVAEKERVNGVKQSLNAVREMKSYLTVRAPFDGVISERNVHEGSLVSSSPSNPPMLKIEQISPLRLLVPVPENAIAGVRIGCEMKFTVSAFVGKQFSGTISRISHELDRKTRTMIVELDVPNSAKELEPGMYAEVIWQMARHYQTLFVPASAVLSREDKTYVARIRNQRAEFVQISRGQPMGKLVEIVGDIKSGDELALNPTDDIDDKTLKTHLLSKIELEKLLSDSGHEQ